MTSRSHLQMPSGNLSSKSWHHHISPFSFLSNLPYPALSRSPHSPSFHSLSSSVFLDTCPPHSPSTLSLSLFFLALQLTLSLTIPCQRDILWQTGESGISSPRSLKSEYVVLVHVESCISNFQLSLLFFFILAVLFDTINFALFFILLVSFLSFLFHSL